MPELQLGFLEHAQWQQNGMHAKRLADLEWWCHQLQGASLKPLLTTDFTRSGKANIGQNPGNIVEVVRLVTPDCASCNCFWRKGAVCLPLQVGTPMDDGLCARLPLAADFSLFL